MQPEVSIIVPVYNVEKYIEISLDSILNQTLKNIEVIIVDDGSSDNCAEIVDRYAEKDNRIKVIHQSNKGVAEARNTGLVNARGKYIGFVDPDDWIEENMYERLYNEAVKNQCDLTACCYRIENEKSRETSAHYLPFSEELINSSKVFREKIAKELIIYSKENAAVWYMLYHSDLIKKNNIIFHKNLTTLEDYTFNMEVFKFVEKFIYIPEPLYHYRVLDHSLTKKFRSNLFDILLYVQNKKDTFMIETNLNAEEYKMLSAKWFIDQVKKIIFLEFAFYSGDSFKIRGKRIGRMLENQNVQDSAAMLWKSEKNKIMLFLIRKKAVTILMIGAWIMASLYKFKKTYIN